MPNPLVAQLNRGSSDLPGALVTRWIAWIQLFDFDVRHVPGKEHTAADGLSRRPATALEEQEAAQEEDIDDFIAAQLSVVNVRAISVSPQISGTEGRVYPLRRAPEEDAETELAPNSLHPGYSEESQQYATFLTTLRRPDGMRGKEFRKVKAEALKFFVQDGHLFRRASKNVPIRRVVDDLADQKTILKALHEDSGHRGREGTYRRVADRYWWKNLAKDASDHCHTCEACQKREPGREEEALHPTYVSVMWKKVAIDLVLMPPVHNYKYLAVLRDDLSGSEASGHKGSKNGCEVLVGSHLSLWHLWRSHCGWRNRVQRGGGRVDGKIRHSQSPSLGISSAGKRQGGKRP